MPIRLSGMVSGMDTESLVTALVSGYQLKKDNLVKAQTKLSWKQEKWKTMNTSIYSFYSGKLSSARFGKAYSLKKSTVSNSSVATVTASSSAVAGDQTLKVKELASSGYLTGGEVTNKSDSTSKITGSSKLSAITNKTSGQGSVTLSVDGKSTNIELTDDMTVNQFLVKLKDAGVQASFDEANQRFFISSKTSGKDGDFSLVANDTAGRDSLYELGLYTDDKTSTAEYTKWAGYYNAADGTYTSALDDIINSAYESNKISFDTVAQEKLAGELKLLLSDIDVKIVYGDEGLIEAATHKEADIVLTAVVGMMGIVPTIKAIEAHKDIALANKETLVTAGHIIMKLAKDNNVNIYPVDSEHSAIFQSLNGEYPKEVERILLTASGGPFRGKKRADLVNVTVEDALNHPNWAMGRKITIDSSTMVNKGLEVMEAQWLFNVPSSKVTVVVQPQSIIHSMVEFIDGGIMAQLGSPDMRLPIQYALYYPHRRELNTKRVDFFELGNITFEKPDMDTFKGLKLAYTASDKGGNIPTAFNAANELAVAKFLDRKIKYLDIPDIIEYAMNEVRYIDNPSVDEILETEQTVYEMIENRLKNGGAEWL